ncbi:hypothetical protein HBI80_054410 [Parastagonospora nodorum]|nr:hypothetical protein HBI80_054410 [Parastagonospora nodorum]
MHSTCFYSIGIFTIHVREVSTQIPARVTAIHIPTPAPPMLPIAVSYNLHGLRKRGVRTYGTLVLIHTGRDYFFVSPVTLTRTSKGFFRASRTRYSYLLCYPNASIAHNCKSQVSLRAV